MTAFDYQRAREDELKKASSLLKVSELKVSERVERLMQELRQREKELDRVKQKAVAGSVDSILEGAADIDDVKVLTYRANGMDMKSLRNLADSLRDRLGSGIIVLASSIDGQAYYVSAVTKDLTGRFHAGQILKAVTGGKGGGRPDMAQGGTKDPEGIESALARVSDIIQGKREKTD